MPIWPKRLAVILFGIVLVGTTATAANDYKGYKIVSVKVNGQPVVSEVPAINFDGRTLLPVRAIAEALGATITWDAETSTVNLTSSPGTAPTTEVLQLRARVVAIEEENTQLKARLEQVTAVGSKPSVEGFRGVPWGSTMDTVQARETATYLGREGDDLLYTGVSIGSLSTTVIYVFTAKGELAQGFYSFTEKHTNENRNIDDYQSLKSQLGEKYGEPAVDRVIWRNNLYRDDSDRYGFAVSLGHLTYMANWKTPESDVTLILSGDNYDVRLAIKYSSLKHMQQLEIEQKAKSGL